MKRIIFLIFILNLIFGQVGMSRNDDNSYSPNFNIDILNNVSDQSGKTKVDIYLQFPYSSLQFVKSGEEYTANYTVSIDAVLLDSEDIMITDVYEESVTTVDYEASISSNSRKISIRSMHLKPGNYEFVVSLLDNESSKELINAVKKKVVKSDTELFLSDLLIIQNSLKIDGQDQLVPNISRIITTELKDLSFYYTINSAKESEINLTYQLLDYKNNTLFEMSQDQKLNAGINPIIKTLSNINFNLGKYKLKILKTGTKDSSFIRTKTINSIIKGFPPSITNLDEAINQMKYIATPSEMDILDEDTLTYNEKMQNFISFWKSKDPDPSTQFNEILNEYFRRVDFANKRFKGYSDGWKTDMGYVFILFGNPDSVERNPFNSNSKPYEVWYYLSMNRRFIFVDYTGFGEYRLMNHDFRDLTDFRY